MIGKIFAYISLVLLIILCIKPLIKNKKIRKYLSKYHILISILFLITLVSHIVLSTNNSFSLYTAKLSIIFLILSIITGIFKKIKLHTIFSIICLIFSILHIIEVKIF